MAPPSFLDCNDLQRIDSDYFTRWQQALHRDSLLTYPLASSSVNPAGDAGDTSPHFLVGGDVNGNIPPILLRTFGYSRTILVALRSFSLKPISFGYKTPPIRFSQAGGQSSHKARPSNLELALTPLIAMQNEPK